MTTPKQAYEKLIELSQELATLSSIASVLGWERETYMPPKGATLRARQSSYLSGLIHRKFTDPRVGEWLALAESELAGDDPFDDAAVNLREWRHDYDRATKVPTELVEEITRTAVMAHSAWVEARAQADFAIFRPHLARLIDLTRKRAECIGYEDNIYDALLDEYEPGMKTADVQRLFDGLRGELVPLVQAISESSRRPKT
ncbi:MAG: carboxypeptidase M32, partial [Caldilineae bacterium]